MSQIPWYLAAVGAALVWGLHYPLVEHALRRVSLFGVLLVTALPILALAPLFAPTLRHDWHVLTTVSWSERALLVAPGLTSLVATALLFESIGAKNASFASLLEISYPVFVPLFAYALFREVQFNASLLVGALLVFAGVTVIVINNP